MSSPSELEILKEWYKYNSFVRKKYLQAIFDKVPEQERYKDSGASFPSIVDIFMHIIDAYRLWFIYAYEDKFVECQMLRGRKSYTREEAETEEQQIDSFFGGFINRLSQDDLTNIFVFKVGEGRYRKVKVRDMLWHLVEEELQHRGELNALFWQLDIDPPVTGWNPFEDDQESISVEQYLMTKTERS